MAPEYGATMGFFPIDEQTLAYLRETGRTDEEVELVERYTKEQQLFRTRRRARRRSYTKVLRLDLGTVEPSLAGPKRPQDRVPLASDEAVVPPGAAGAGQRSAASRWPSDEAERRPTSPTTAARATIGHGAVVIAAITSCTNTSNPSVMLAAGLLAKKAVERGLQVQPHVKTSLAPGLAAW